MSHDSMPDRVRQILVDQKITKAKLAAAARVSKGAVTQWSTGDTTIGFEAAQALHREYGYSIRWLIEGARPRMAKDAERYVLADQTEHELIDLWRALVPPQRDEILARLRALKNNNDTLFAQMTAQRASAAKAQ